MANVDLTEAGQALLSRINYPNSLPRDFGSHKIIETHVSVVLIGKAKVLKFKKSVDLGFVDHTQITVRWASASNEILLNRRLSKGVYLGLYPFDSNLVQKLNDSAIGTKLLTDCDPKKLPTDLVEVAVVMNRLSDESFFDQALSQGKNFSKELSLIADRLLEFHQQQRSCAIEKEFGTCERIRSSCLDNISETKTRLGSSLSKNTSTALSIVEQFTNNFIEQNQKVFEKRIESAFVIDGHGDLRAEHICFLNGEPSFIDCIEFSDELRTVDILSDLAFLTTDFEHHGRADLAESLESHYKTQSEDIFDATLYGFYKSYRAMVRAKVAAIRSNELQKIGDTTNYKKSLAESERYIAQATRHSLLIPSNCLIAIGGLMGIGKSTLADLLSSCSDGKVLRADEIRKSIFGSDKTDRTLDYNAGKYSAEASERTYKVMMIEAKKEIKLGNPVILDASFSKLPYRQSLEKLVEDSNIPHIFVWCTLDEEATFARLTKRENELHSISDGRKEIYQNQLSACDYDGNTKLNSIEVDLAEISVDTLYKITAGLSDL